MATGELVSTGVVEIERDGMIRRGEYRKDGAVLTVSYGGQVRKLRIQPRAQDLHIVARMLLREIVTEVQRTLDQPPRDGRTLPLLAWHQWRRGAR
jgi:hypothetical protein